MFLRCSMSTKKTMNSRQEDSWKLDERGQKGLPRMRSLGVRFNDERNARYGRMIFPRTDKYVGTSIQLYGEFSEGEAVLFKQVVLPGMRILEVGANIGALTLPLALIAGSEGEVHAFEPQRQLFYSLCGNLALNSITNVVAYNVGLGATSYVGKMPAINYGMVGN